MSREVYVRNIIVEGIAKGENESRRLAMQALARRAARGRQANRAC